MSQRKTLAVITGLFCSAVVMTNAVSALVVKVGPFVCVAGALLYPVTFLLTDVLSEVYGKATATMAVLTGFVCQLLAVAFVQVVAVLPGLDPVVEHAWRQVFMPMTRIAVASMAAYLVAQLIDVHVFHLVKRMTNGRALWVRNNASTTTSQAVDTLVFVTVAFAGVMPLHGIVQLALGQYALKAILALLDTPVCYGAVWCVKRLHRSSDGQTESS